MMFRSKEEEMKNKIKKYIIDIHDKIPWLGFPSHHPSLSPLPRGIIPTKPVPVKDDKSDGSVRVTTPPLPLSNMSTIACGTRLDRASTLLYSVMQYAIYAHL